MQTIARLYWLPRTGIPQHIFYTFIGNFILDYGIIATFVIFILISISTVKLIKNQGNYYPFYKLIPLSILINISSRGFCFFTYAGISGNKMLFYTIFWYIFFKFTSQAYDRSLIKYNNSSV